MRERKLSFCICADGVNEYGAPSYCCYGYKRIGAELIPMSRAELQNEILRDGAWDDENCCVRGLSVAVFSTIEIYCRQHRKQFIIKKAHENPKV